MQIALRLDMKPREAPKLEIAQRTCRRSRPAICSGIGVAVLGTAVLIVLAASCSDLSTDEGLSSSGLSGCAARLLIAGAVGLANLAHIVGLMLFQTVRYRGFWRNFFAQLSLYGTLAGIGASLLVD